MQYEIYERLHVNDRLSLNRALPAGERLLRSRERDKRLMIADIVVRSGWVALGELPGEVWLILNENPRDPTVRKIVADFGIVLRTPGGPPTTGPGGEVLVSPGEELCSMLAEGRATPADVDATNLSELTEDQKDRLLDTVACYGTPELFGALLRHPHLDGFCYPDSLHLGPRGSSLLFSAINYGNTELLRELVRTYASAPIIKRGIEHFRNSDTLLNIWRYTPNKIRMYSDFIGCSTNNVQQLRRAAVKDFDIPLIMRLQSGWPPVAAE